MINTYDKTDFTNDYEDRERREEELEQREAAEDKLAITVTNTNLNAFVKQLKEKK